MKDLKPLWSWAKIAFFTFRSALEIAVPLVAVAIIGVVYLTLHILGKAH